jgi:two-component system, OmpR family, alkaline phosphatase synthesis response regulator PhoP
LIIWISEAFLSKPKILIIDDEKNILNLIKAYLIPEGYEVFMVADGINGLAAAQSTHPDIIILDVMLPGLDGIGLLTQLRRDSNVYVILLTARSEESDKIIGLSLGADDYITKPFSPRELVARVKAALRRMKQGENSKEEEIAFQDLIINIPKHEVWFENSLIELTPIEFDLLKTLAENNGIVLSRVQLLTKVWGYTYYGDDRVVDVHIGHIRQKIGGERYIQTIHGIGYRFVGNEVQVAQRDSDAFRN